MNKPSSLFAPESYPDGFVLRTVRGFFGLFDHTVINFLTSGNRRFTSVLQDSPRGVSDVLHDLPPLLQMNSLSVEHPSNGVVHERGNFTQELGLSSQAQGGGND